MAGTTPVLSVRSFLFVLCRCHCEHVLIVYLTIDFLASSEHIASNGWSNVTCGGELLDLSQLIPLLDLPFHLKTQFTKPSFWSEGRLEVTPTIVAGRGFQIILIRQGATKFLANVTTMPHFFFFL